MIAVRVMNLFLGVFWLIVGGAILANDHLTGQPRLVLPIAGGISAGWLAMVLAAYNFVRWWMVVQTAEAEGRTSSSLERPRAKIVRPAAEPNPELDFTSRHNNDTPPNGTALH